MYPLSAPRLEPDTQRSLALLEMAEVVSRGSDPAKALIESEQLLTAYFTASKVGLCILDADLRYLAINRTLAEMNGIPAEAHLGKSVREMLGDFAELVETQFHRVLETQQPILNLEISSTLHNRTEPGHWIEHYIPIKDATGKIKQIGVVAVEVTEQKKLEESLRGVSEKLREEKKRQEVMIEVSRVLAAKWDARQVFRKISAYVRRVLRQEEGQTPRGVFVLCSGKVKLSTTSKEGKILILKQAEAGEVLGLSAAISGTNYEMTAETASPCQLNFIGRQDLMTLLQNESEVEVHSALWLSREFQGAYRDIHDLVLARSSSGKLARLLLSCAPPGVQESQELRLNSAMTHEEMAQRIGSSRETVTRLLSDLKKKRLIRLEGATLVIRDRTGLEALAV